MKKIVRKRKGSASVVGTILLVTILGLGLIVGAVSVRDQITQEFGDLSVALDNLDQSYFYRIAIDPDAQGPEPAIISAQGEYVDPAPTLMDPEDMPSAGIVFTVPTNGEAPADTPAGTLP